MLYGPIMLTIESLESRRLFAISFSYATAFGDLETLDIGNSVAVDAGGNTYFAGTFRGKIDVDKSNSKKKFLTADDNYDAFLVKYGPTGKLIWAQQYGTGDGDESINRLLIGPNGDLYATGTFEETVDFDAKAGVHKLVSHGKVDAFILHLRPNGNYVWAGNIGGELDDAITAFAVGPSGDMYYSGYVRLRGDADPTKAVRNIFDRGVDDTIIARLNGTNGAVKWMKVFGENATRETVFGLAVDADESLLAAGMFNETVAFDRRDESFNREAVGSDDVYLARLDPGGEFQFIKTFGGKKQETIADMVQDDAGNIYLTGNFAKTTDFEPGPGQTLLAAPGDTAAYVLKMDGNANLTWVRMIGAAIIGGHDEDATVAARGIAVDAGGGVYSVGDFSGTVDFDPGAGLKAIEVDKSGNTPALPGQVEASDTYVQRLDADGNFVEVKRFGGDDGTSFAHDIAIDPSGGINIVGSFSGFVDLNPTSGAFRRSTQDDRNDSNVFLVKLLA
jgi:hypothetical protein